MNSGNARDRAAVAAWQRAVAEHLQTLRTEAEGVQRLLDALNEQRAVVHEERLCMTAQYRLLADDGCPEDWARHALEQERTLLREESVLAREWLRLLDEQRRLRQERLALLEPQEQLFKFAESRSTETSDA